MLFARMALIATSRRPRDTEIVHIAAGVGDLNHFPSNDGNNEHIAKVRAATFILAGDESQPLTIW